MWTILSQLLHNVLDFMVSLMYVHTHKCDWVPMAEFVLVCLSLYAFYKTCRHKILLMQAHATPTNGPI